MGAGRACGGDHSVGLRRVGMLWDRRRSQKREDQLQGQVDDLRGQVRESQNVILEAIAADGEERQKILSEYKVRISGIPLYEAGRSAETSGSVTLKPDGDG